MTVLNIRGLAMGVALVVAFAIGAFVGLNHGDETAQAAPQAQPAAAVPQGFVAGYEFECVSFGITLLLNGQSLPGSYKCDSEESEAVTCLSDQVSTVACSPDAVNINTCTLVTGSPTEAECTSPTGPHFCSLDQYEGVNCLDSDGGDGNDYVECYQTEGLSTLECGTQYGPMVCVIPVTESLVPQIVCRTLYRSLSALWADVDCNGSVNVRDQQSILRIILGNAPLGQTEPCVEIGQPTFYSPGGDPID